MSLRHRTVPSQPGRPPAAGAIDDEPYNIIPVNNLLADHPSLRYPEVRAAAAALKTVGDLRRPTYVQWRPHYDLLDWLALFFGFQKDNVRNQREHLVLHLANAQMRLTPPPDNIDSLDPAVVRRFRRKLLGNYSSWCSYLGRKSNIWISDRNPDSRRELLYVGLYLLVWGEAANLRFMPECICYIFHNMASELNKILEDCLDESTGQPYSPRITGENSFLNGVVKPIYETIKAEINESKNGTEPHCKWRNYDDINEYFWTDRCFSKLKWPIDLGSSFFKSSRGSGVGKTGFVERRTFFYLYRSFDRLWVMLALFLQAAIIVAWEEKPGGGSVTSQLWNALKSTDVQVRLLTVFLTWSGMRLLQAVLDAGSQRPLISRETKRLFFRMLMKVVAATVWIIAFIVLYTNIWKQRKQDRQWSRAANDKIYQFLYAVVAFLVPEILALALFIVPWIRNFLEETNWKIFFALTWWFQGKSFVGRGLREGLVDNIKYSTFWIFVLATKFTFSYFLQVKPMIKPSKLLWNLKEVDYEWHQFFGKSNRFSVLLLWLPVVLIYLMDIQIWYAIYSSIVGAVVGLFDHLGEIRDMGQLRLRFQFFASAIQFNLMPEEQLLNARGFGNKLKDAIHRLKLRYGLGRPFKKLESNQVEANKFALIWNEIILAFREEDIVSDREVELLELPKNSWNVTVIRWPCFLLCNELLLALSQAKELVDAPDKWLWHKICKNEYRRCAVVEAYESIKHLLLSIIKIDTEEHKIVTIFFQMIEVSIQGEQFTKTFKVDLLPKIYETLQKLVGLLNDEKVDVGRVVNGLQSIYEIATRQFFIEKKTTEQLSTEGLTPHDPASKLLFQNAVRLPDASNEDFFRQVRRLHTILTSRDSMHSVPVNLEARRRIAFFSNSLFMNLPHAPQVEKMLAFSVMTPYYSEEVVYSKEQLRNETEDGISTLYYLQTIYADEWKNFKERMRREGIKTDVELWTTKLRELRLWASYRGQTLARTVRGMMYYYRALKMLAFLDSASEMDIREDAQELGSMRSSQGNRLDGVDDVNDRSSLSRATSSVSMLYKGHEHGTALMKFTYVVACQIYGSQKAKKEPQAEEILYLMKQNEALRIAYVDEVHAGRGETEYYSVLVKYDHTLEREVEIFRVKLPGPVKLGEGKPENQNHAMIFTRGDAVQTIDMNQDNYFEEALKMRNLLQEFRHYHGIRKPTILGVREHIFTGSVSSLAWFMSAQETSFVTLGQRVLANPLKVRMHYGHPDVFDRFWFLSRGGISKASRVINISEDIFAGFNCTLRGGNVTHHEYIQVGKGRDVGLNQISMFEAKVASGNGEQVLSRDVYRLGHRLDFFRMLSFFYTTVGFFFNTMMVILTVYAFLWGRVYLALSGVEKSALADSTDTNAALAVILNQQFIIQLGLFTALPMIVEWSLEEGFLLAIWNFIRMQIQLSSVFYTFSMGTRAHYFGRTILHGGAKYRATGRGFVVEHKNFTENYRLYARSHFVKAIELGLILIVYATHSPIAKDSLIYIAMTLTSWFLVISWILAPFVFNPSGFDWLKTVYDFEGFMNWIWYQGRISTKSEQSWEIWWYEEQDHLRTTGLPGRIMEIILDLRFFFFQYGIVYQLKIANGSTSILVYLLSWIYIFAVFVFFLVIQYARDKYSARNHIRYRLVQFLLIVFGTLVIVALLEFTHFSFVDIFTSLLAFVPTGWGILLIAQALRPALQKIGLIWNAVISLARLYDILFGIVIMVPVAFMSWMPGFQSMQTRILFNEAFSRGLRIMQIVTGKKSKGDVEVEKRR
uniref:1,3-beta-glucan synthase n=1 Tax=Brassica oleracea TaxID=3712 RepID=A0A3P6D9N7_BRAOL|nr:unnamed protein product [Brassica oleracea]